MSDRVGTLLLYAPVPLHRKDGVLHLEDQACNGLRLWAEHFEKLILMIPEASGPLPPAWVPLERVGPSLERIELLIVPEAWRPDRFLRALPSQKPRIREAIARADYVGFAIGGLWGDWGSYAAWQAHKMKKPFYIWTDRVESAVVRRTLGSLPLRRRVRARVEVPLMAALERALIRRSTLGLFHGRETYDTYAPYASNPQLVHDIHLKRADHIPPEMLAAKIAGAAEGPLKIVYAGRATAMKGAMDWLSVLEGLAARGVDFTATWLGDGPDFAAMQARVAEGPLQGRVALPGFVSDRPTLLTALREADLMLFCHKTPESPRILIEALASGCPIVGYDSPFPADLIDPHGGGKLVALDDVAGLTEAVAALAQDRTALSDLIAKAAQDGAIFDDEAVFAHRSELIRENLPGPR